MDIMNVRNVTIKRNVAREWQLKSDFLRTWKNKHDAIIVFAGVFDPIHVGHISAAKDALRYGSRVVFMPERVPQHKHGATPFKHRCNMIRAALSDQPNMELIDTYPHDHHWVEETFSWLNTQYPNTKFIWLIGQDVEEHIANWNGVDKLKELSVPFLLVMGREHTSHEYLEELHGIPVIHTHRPLHRDYLVSSTEFRDNPEKNRHLVPESVLQYCVDHNLYSSEDASK